VQLTDRKSSTDETQKSVQSKSNVMIGDGNLKKKASCISAAGRPIFFFFLPHKSFICTLSFAPAANNSFERPNSGRNSEHIQRKNKTATDKIDACRINIHGGEVSGERMRRWNLLTSPIRITCTRNGRAIVIVCKLAVNL
jgi:hypothetical protein